MNLTIAEVYGEGRSDGYSQLNFPCPSKEVQAYLVSSRNDTHLLDENLENGFDVRIIVGIVEIDMKDVDAMDSMASEQ